MLTFLTNLRLRDTQGQKDKNPKGMKGADQTF